MDEAVVDQAPGQPAETAAETEVDREPETAATTLPHWRRNFAANFIDVSFFSLGLAFSSYTTIVPLYVRELGGATWLVGLAPSIVQTGFLLPPLFIAPYLGRLRRKLPYLLWVTTGERVPWLLLALITYFLGTRYPTAVLTMAICFLAVIGLTGGLATPAWMDLVTRVTPLRMRGKLFGWSSSLAGLLGVPGGLLAERALARYGFPFGFTLCFLATAICMTISFVALCFLRELPAHEVAPALTVRDYLRRLPALLRADRDFTTFLGVRVLTMLGNMAVGFVAVYAVEEQGLASSMAGRFTAFMLGTQVLTTPLFGTIGDRQGHKVALQFGLACSALAAMLVLFVTTPAGFYVVFSLLGASAGVLFSTTLNVVVEFANPIDRVTYIGLHATLIAPWTLLAPLLGGWIVEAAGFGPLFIAATTFSLLGLGVLTVFVRDPRHRQLTGRWPAIGG